MTNIVRVEAGILRKRLADYFGGEADEPIVLSIPKGSYLPLFEPASLQLSPLGPRANLRRSRSATPAHPFGTTSSTELMSRIS